MTMTARRRRLHRRLAALPGVRAVRRPVGPDSSDHFDLYYVRTGPKSPHPLVVIPGGPGAASVALYRTFRGHATAAGLDVIMIEHRGVGLSRHDDTGADLPAEAMSVEAAVDDIAAVLDDAAVETAVIYGASYGSYLASGVGVRYPERVYAMTLDSPLLCADDIDEVRAQIRRVLWDGEVPGTAELATKIRILVEGGVLTRRDVQLVADLYGTGGPEVLSRQLDLLLSGHPLVWRAVGFGTRMLLERQTPFHHEPDLVERIAFRELNYGAEPDGGPLDPAVVMRETAGGDVGFVAEPFDLRAALPGFHWPTAVLSGGRDLTTPPAVAHRVAELIPCATLVELPTAGHSILDTREPAALQVCAAAVGDRLPQLAFRGPELDALPANATIRLLTGAVSVAARAESLLPGASS